MHCNCIRIYNSFITSDLMQMHCNCIQRKRKQEKETFPPAPPIKKKNIKKKKRSTSCVLLRACAREDWHKRKVLKKKWRHPVSPHDCTLDFIENP